MSEIVQGGSTANLNGKIFESTLIPMFKKHGYIVFSNKELKKENHQKTYETAPKVIHTNAPFISIYNNKGKTEFLLINRILNREIRIECKWQQSAGSVDEKFPYMLLNCIYAFKEKEIFLLVDGGGYKESARRWLDDRIKERWLLEDQDEKQIKLIAFHTYIHS